MKNDPAKNPNYYVDPAKMKDCIREGNFLQAKVIGTSTYKVKVEITGNKLNNGRCSCPAYRNYANCKHIIALGIAYQKHPEWFEKMNDAEKRIDKIPPEKAVAILKMLINTVPEVKKIIGCELMDLEGKTETYCRYIRESFKSGLSGPDDETFNELDMFHNNSKQFLKDKEYFACIKLCYEIIYGCLSADADFGSTEIFPESFVYDVWQTYLKALKNGRFSSQEKDKIKEQLDKLNFFESYLFDQEGVYPEEGMEYIKKRGEVR